MIKILCTEWKYVRTLSITRLICCILIVHNVHPQKITLTRTHTHISATCQGALDAPLATFARTVRRT